MNIAIITRPHPWRGGDLVVLNNIKTALEEKGHDTILVKVAEEIAGRPVDLAVFSNLPVNHMKLNFRYLKLHKIPYVFIPVAEDMALYRPAAKASDWIYKALLEGNIKNDDVEEAFNRLAEDTDYMDSWNADRQPYIFHDIDGNTPPGYQLNKPIVDGALGMICSSDWEKKLVESHFPDSPEIKIQNYPMTVASGSKKIFPESFKEAANGQVLPKNGFVLQVGRQEHRKNQLTTLWAMRELEIPLVFVMNFQEPDYYLKLMQQVVMRCNKYRQERTYFIRGLDDDVLASAFKTAGLVVSPHFHETPGHTIMEGLFNKTAVVTSDWGSTREYAKDCASYLDKPWAIKQFTELIESKLNSPKVNKPSWLKSASWGNWADTILEFAKDANLPV